MRGRGEHDGHVVRGRVAGAVLGLSSPHAPAGVVIPPRLLGEGSSRGVCRLPVDEQVGRGPRHAHGRAGRVPSEAVVRCAARGEKGTAASGRRGLGIHGTTPRVVLEVEPVQEDGAGLGVEQGHREAHEEQQNDHKEYPNELASVVEVFEIEVSGHEEQRDDDEGHPDAPVDPPHPEQVEVVGRAGVHGGGVGGRPAGGAVGGDVQAREAHLLPRGGGAEGGVGQVGASGQVVIVVGGRVRGGPHGGACAGTAGAAALTARPRVDQHGVEAVKSGGKRTEGHFRGHVYWSCG